MTILQLFWSLLRKDLTIEFRSREILYPMALFSFLMVLIFSFAFLSDPARARDLGPGIIWVTILFSATVGLNRLFDPERENGCLWALLLGPVPGGVVFLAKVAVHLLFTGLMEVLTIPLIFMFFDLSLADPWSLWSVLVLGTFAISLIGTLFSAMLMNARMKEVLLPLVVYPVLVPVVIAGCKVTALALGAPIAEDSGPWLRFLAGFDMIFGVVTLGLFERMVRA